jgi:hypothetical protein
MRNGTKQQRPQGVDEQMLHVPAQKKSTVYKRSRPPSGGRMRRGKRPNKFPIIE